MSSWLKAASPLLCKFIVGAELENAEIFNEVVHIMCRQEKENKCELNFYEMMEPLFENMDTIYQVRAELFVLSNEGSMLPRMYKMYIKDVQEWRMLL